MMKRLTSFIALAVIAACSPAIVVVFALAVYGFVYRGIELIALAVFVDAFFMHSAVTLPYYTMGVACMLIVLELVRPYLLVYNQTD